MPHQWRIRKSSDRPDWLDASQIGSVVDGVLFTQDMYLDIERRYIDVSRSFAQESHIALLRVQRLEVGASGQVINPHGWNNDNGIDLEWLKAIHNDQELSLEEGMVLLKAILRGLVWCTLESRQFYIEVGFDYYLYVGSYEDCQRSIEMAKSLKLTIRKIKYGQYRARESF